MSETVVSLRGETLLPARRQDIAAMLRRMADKADAGEFDAVALVALMPNGSSFTSWNIDRPYAYAMIGAGYAMLNDITSSVVSDPV